MTMTPSNAHIVQLVSPGCQRAIDKALHEADPDHFHERITGVCPHCLTLGEKLAAAFKNSVAGSDLAIQAKERISAMMDAQDADA